ncbi:MAG: protein kinase [Acidobacteriaceae bacterium]
MSLAPGSRLGDYEIVAPLGAGGMGEVYRARDARLGREVAIKVLPEYFSKDPVRLARFEQEARAAAALNHPNILVVYQMGTWEGFPYLVAELLEGETLRERLNRGPLPLRKVIDYGVQIARGLEAAHRKGIVHRDLKPENLLLTKDGHVKILDFGLARMTQSEGAEVNEAATFGGGAVQMGTVGYMSPEQVRGLPTNPQSDIFSFTVILREMLTGQRTFQKGTSVETMTAILNEEPPPIGDVAPHVPPGLQKILYRGLDKDPDHRFQTASDLAFALEAISDAATRTVPVQYVTPKERATRQRNLRGGVVLVVVAGIGLMLYLATRPEPTPVVANYAQLTHDGGQKTLIGTDGARLYLSVITSAVQRTAAIPVAGGEPVDIPMPAPNMEPVGMAADGSEFLVVQGGGVPFRGALWSLPVLGGSPRRLAETVGDAAAWSADGQKLAYGDGGNLYVAKADGTEPHKILTEDSQVDDLVWSPDGHHLRFGTSQEFGSSIGQHMLWEVAADGSGLHRLLPGWHTPPDECCGTWSKDGKFFVFESQGQVWALPGSKRFLHAAAAPMPLTSSPMSLSSPVAGKDGRKLFVVGATYRGELTRYDVRTREFVPFLDGISAEYVSFSRDGQWAAYVSYPEGTLWRCRIDGSERLQLTSPPLHAVLPRWSPDGKTLVFFEFAVSSTQPGRIYEVPSAGGSVTELMPNDKQNQMDPNWSPDGKQIVFSGSPTDAATVKTPAAIHILDVATGQVSMVPGSQGFFSPRWSPDGKSIAAMSADSSTLLLFDVATQKWSEVMRGTFGWINWSKDGQFIYFLDFTGKGSVARVRVADHKVERVADLTNFVTTGQYGGSLALAPDDAPLLLRDRGSQDVYALDWTE